MRLDSLDRPAMYLALTLLAALALAVPAGAQGCGASQTWVPPGSGVSAAGQGRLLITPPAGFTYAGSAGANGALTTASSINISCACASGGGTCYVSLINGRAACINVDCTDCRMVIESAASADVFRLGGFAELAADVTFLTDPYAPRPAAFRELFELPEVQARLDAFLGQIPSVYSQPLPGGGAQFTAPEGWSAVPVSVAGRAAFVVVPTQWASAAGLAAAAGGTCSCTSGTCTYNSTWTPKGTLHYCEGNCSGTCTLSMNSVAAPGTAFGFDKPVY